MKSYCIWCNTGWKLLYLMWCQFCLFFWKWDRWAGIGILKWAEKTIEILWAVGWKCDGIIHVGSHVMVHGGRHVIVHGGSNTSSSQVIIHVATIRDVYFRHRKRVRVGLWGPGDILRRFQNVMDQAIHDEILRNVTRCDLWRSIHDVIWDRHRYCFMTVFQWSVTKFYRHGSIDFL